MIKTILVPTDYSKNAHNAVRYAVELAHLTGAKITFFHSYYLPIYVKNIPKDTAAEAGLRKEVSETLDAILKDKKYAASDIKYDIIVKDGSSTVNEIVGIAKEIAADMIVMGTKGSTGVGEVIFGSNTHDVIEKTEIPVLAIPIKAASLEFKNIVFATNYHFNDFNALDDLVLIAKLFDSRITVLHIDDGEMIHDFEYSMLDTFHLQVTEKADYPNIHFQLLENKNVFEGLQDFIHHNEIDLLALSSRKKVLYNRLFGKSISRKMAYHADIPLMIFKIAEDDEITDF